jgi:hypothetical protein
MKGLVVVQAVNRWFPTAVAGYDPMSDPVGFIVDKVSLGKVFTKYFSFSCQFSFC